MNIKKKFVRLLPIFLLAAMLFSVTGKAEAAGPSAVPTFNSLGIYWSPAEGSGSVECLVQYRIAGALDWKSGLSLWYDDRDDEYRGSIVELLPGTSYDIKLELDGEGITQIFQVSTWKENFPIAQTIELAENSGSTLIINQSGTPNGYILYTYGSAGSATIDVAGASDMNIEINASYIIIRGLTLRNAARHAIKILGDNHDIVIEKCDISGWGLISDTSGGEIWGYNYDSAIYAWDDTSPPSYTKIYEGQPVNDVMRVIVQRNWFHHPRSDSNAWDEIRWDSQQCIDNYNNDGDKARCHPKGPQVVSLVNTAGNHVIRFNTIESDDDHYYNDVFGAGDNFSDRGFPNRDSDIYGNYIERAWDDAIESEGANENVRIWGNYMDKTNVKIAIAGTSVGPLYIWRNVGDTSTKYALPVNSDPVIADIHTYEGFEDFRGTFIKAGGKYGYLGGRTYVFHNTTLQRDPAPGYLYKLGSSSGIGSVASLRELVTRNNIFMNYKNWQATYYVKTESCFNDLDYDLYNGKVWEECADPSHQNNGIFIGNLSKNNIATYEDNYPEYDPNNGPGEFALAAGEPGIDAGVCINNFNDCDSNPDMGAFEAGSAPMEFGVDAYKDYDTDGDGVNDDGDSSGIVGDNPCEGGDTESCDDKCPYFRPARVEGVTTDYYSSLQSAYENAADGNIIQGQDHTFIEDLSIDKSISAVIQGGLDCGYANITGTTILNGSLSVTNGRLEISGGRRDLK